MPSSAILSALRAATAEQWELVGLVAVVAYVTYNAYFHPLSKYPGPTSARMGLPGVWLFWQAYKRRYAWALEEQHDKYGPIVRVSANQVSINTPEAASIIYAHGSSAAFPKTRFYQSFQVYPTKPSLFSDIHTESHAAFRRAISSAYSMNSLVKLEEYIEPLVSSLVKSLDKAGSGGKRMANEVEGGPATVVSLDMAKWLHFFAMDAVGELAFGRAFGFVERGGDPNRFLLGVSNLSHWGSMAGWTPSISQSARKALRWISGEPGGATVGLMTKPLIDRRYELLAAKQARAEGRDSVPKMSASTSKAEEANLEDREDMLARFIECKSPVTSQVLTSEEVLRTAISVVGAGSDTTSTALVAFFGYLVRHPAVYKALQAEIDEAFDTGALSWPVQYNHAVKLELLQACIKETLRLHPPISMSLPRCVADRDGLVLHQGVEEYSSKGSGGGIVIPKGCQVSVAPYVLHRSKAAFGGDARSYNPYRWIDLDERKRKDLERHNLTFGGGSRSCIGKNISLMEINKVLPTLLRAFDFCLPAAHQYGPTFEGRDADGRIGRDVPWRCQSTWFLEVQSFPLLVQRRPDVEVID